MNNYQKQMKQFGIEAIKAKIRLQKAHVELDSAASNVNTWNGEIEELFKVHREPVLIEYELVLYLVQCVNGEVEITPMEILR